MRTGHHSAAALLAAWLLAVPGTPALAEAPECYARDAQGRSFRVCFDPGTELRLAAAGGASCASGWAGSAELQLDLVWRDRLQYGEADDLVTWQLDHRFATGWIRPWELDFEGLPSLDLTAYEASYVRHSSAGYLVFPSSPPTRLLFPLDLGVDLAVGRVRAGIRPTDERSWLQLGAARAGVLFDPWRSGRPGCGLEIGLGARYDLDLLGDPRLEDGVQVVHRVSPFTAASLRFRIQDDAGLTAADVRAEVFPHWASQGGWALGAEASARVQRVVLAINDEPISIFAEAGYDRLPPALDLEAAHSVRLLAGLAIGIQLRD
ncbi:MAG: hypothetical protein JXR96_11540 [Deltaproteobacteria bacterium]|nr:hypothetical protein [Deltaproteobacteria bacterium]